MAQLVARLVRNEKVGGSNPPSSTTSKVCPASLLAGQTFFNVPVVLGGGGQVVTGRLQGAPELIASAGTSVST